MGYDSGLSLVFVLNLGFVGHVQELVGLCGHDFVIVLMWDLVFWTCRSWYLLIFKCDIKSSLISLDLGLGGPNVGHDFGLVGLYMRNDFVLVGLDPGLLSLYLDLDLASSPTRVMNLMTLGT